MFSEFDTHVKYMTFLPPYYRYIALFFYRFILHFAVVKTTFCRNTFLSFFLFFLLFSIGMDNDTRTDRDSL